MYVMYKLLTSLVTETDTHSKSECKTLCHVGINMSASGYYGYCGPSNTVEGKNCLS